MWMCLDAFRDGLRADELSGEDAEEGSDMTIGLDSVVPRMAIGSLVLACTAMVAACGNSSSGGSQVVASAGGEEITETQVTHVLEHQANMRPEHLDGASRKAVAGLVEQAVVLQK